MILAILISAFRPYLPGREDYYMIYLELLDRLD